MNQCVGFHWIHRLYSRIRSLKMCKRSTMSCKSEWTRGRSARIISTMFMMKWSYKWCSSANCMESRSLYALRRHRAPIRPKAKPQSRSKWRLQMRKEATSRPMNTNICRGKLARGLTNIADRADPLQVIVNYNGSFQVQNYRHNTQVWELELIKSKISTIKAIQWTPQKLKSIQTLR